MGFCHDHLVHGPDLLPVRVRHGAVALDIADDLPVIVAVTFGEGQADLQTAGVVDDSHPPAVQIEDHRCTRGLVQNGKEIALSYVLRHVLQSLKLSIYLN